MYDVEQLRAREFPLTRQCIYFNNASIAPLPLRTRESSHRLIDQLSNAPGTMFTEFYQPFAEELKKDLAAFINAASPDSIVSVTTTSSALNAFAQSFGWESGDNVCFCDVEFPSNAYPWLQLSRLGVEPRQLRSDRGGLTVEALAPYVDDRTRVVAVSAVQFFTGHRTDLVALGDFCRQRGIVFVVDAIQAIGHRPIDVQAMGISVLATGGQKSLLAMPGIGFMYVEPSLCTQLIPRFLAANATVDFQNWLQYDLTPQPDANRFMAGTPNIAGIVGVRSSVALLRELGVANIERHTRRLTAVARRHLETRGFPIVTDPEQYASIITFDAGLDDAAADTLVEELAGQGAFVSKRADGQGKPHIRLSFHCFNAVDEIERFMVLLDELLELMAARTAHEATKA